MLGLGVQKFVEQFEVESLSGQYPRGSSGQDRVIDASGEVIDIGFGRHAVLGYLEEILETIPWYQCTHASPYITALLDSCLDSGFIDQSIEEISSVYAGVLQTALDVAELERWRHHIMEHGEVIGMGSYTAGELRFHLVMASCHAGSEDGHGHRNRFLNWLRQQLDERSKKCDTDLGPLLLELAKQQYQRTARELKAKTVERSMKCDESTAKQLAELYNHLPRSPFWF